MCKIKGKTTGKSPLYSENYKNLKKYLFFNTVPFSREIRLDPDKTWQIPPHPPYDPRRINPDMPHFLSCIRSKIIPFAESLSLIGSAELVNTVPRCLLREASIFPFHSDQLILLGGQQFQRNGLASLSPAGLLVSKT